MKGLWMLVMASVVASHIVLSAVEVAGVEDDPRRCALALCVLEGDISGYAHERCLEDKLGKDSGDVCAELAMRQGGEKFVPMASSDCAPADWRCRLPKHPPTALLQPSRCGNCTGVVFGFGVPVVPNFVGAMPAGD